VLADADQAGTRRSRAGPGAIGGIDAQRLPDVLDAGARRVVVVRAITAAEDPRAAAEQLAGMLDSAV
jgi:thiamine-phosphate pyrophosphorylase